MLRVFLLLCVLVFPISKARAFTGLELMRECSNYAVFARSQTVPEPKVLMGTARCMGYLQGIMDANQMVVGLKGKQSALFCNPESGLETEQVILIVLKHLRDNPATLHESARINVVVALRKSFPCP